MVRRTPTARPPLDVAFVLDTSSSMAGRASAAVRGAAQRITQAHLTGPHDRVSMLLASSSVRQAVQRTHAKNVDWDALDARHGDGRGGMHCSRGTALWDAVYTALHSLCYREADARADGSQHRLPHPHVIVLTDGGDNASSSAVTQLVADGLLRKPSEHGLKGVGMAHLQVHFLTVGPLAEERLLQDMQLIHRDQLPQHVAVLPAADEAGVAALLQQDQRHGAHCTTALTTTFGIVMPRPSIGGAAAAAAAQASSNWRVAPLASDQCQLRGRHARGAAACGGLAHPGRRHGLCHCAAGYAVGDSTGQGQAGATRPQPQPGTPGHSDTPPHTDDALCAGDNKQQLMLQLARLMVQLAAA